MGMNIKYRIETITSDDQSHFDFLVNSFISTLDSVYSIDFCSNHNLFIAHIQYSEFIHEYATLNPKTDRPSIVYAY